MPLYYKDFYDYIPSGIVDKRVTGIGLTSFALENEIPTVIAVPTIGIIENKVEQYPNERRSDPILGIYGKFSEYHLELYLKEIAIPKIIVTYDSFHKVAPYLTSKYQIIIDEFSELLDAYSYRDKAIKSLLKELDNLRKRQCNNISFISATPIDPKYLPKELKSIPCQELDFGPLEKVQIGRYQTARPYASAANYIINFRLGKFEFNGNKPEALYFFINSVTEIATLIEKVGLNPSEVRVICNPSSDNKYKLKKAGITKIETALDPEKPINFITSRNFKGTDFYSEKGISIIVSNNTNLNTLLTIDTDIFQIAGRIRTEENPFRRYLIHIFNSDPLGIDDGKYQDLMNQKREAALHFLNIYKKVDEDEMDTFLWMLKTAVIGKRTAYLRLGPDKIPRYDDLAELNDLRIYHNIVRVYRDGMTINEAYSNSQKFQIDPQFNLKLDYFAKKSFFDISKDYYDGLITDKAAICVYPIMEAFIAKLGRDRLKANSFNLTKLTSELESVLKSEVVNSDEAIKNLFHSKTILPYNETKYPGFYLCTDIKTHIQRLFNTLGIKKIAKSTMIKSLFNCKKDTIKVKQQKLVDGIIREAWVSMTGYYIYDDLIAPNQEEI